MPLIILGLMVVAGIVIYALVRYRQNEEVDTRTVRERYPHVFETIDQKIDQMKKGANYTIIDDDDEDVEDNNAKYRDEDRKKEKKHSLIRKCRSMTGIHFISVVLPHMFRPAASRVPFPYHSKRRT